MRSCFNRILDGAAGGGGLQTPLGFFLCHCQMAEYGKLKLPDLGHSLLTFCNFFFGTRSDQVRPPMPRFTKRRYLLQKTELLTPKMEWPITKYSIITPYSGVG